MTLPHEANFIALKGIRKTVADKLGKSQSLLDKYCASPKSHDGDGEISPTEKFLEFVLAIQRVDDKRAHLLLDYVLAECGCMPVVPAPRASTLPNLLDMSKSMQAFAKYVEVLAKASTDGVVTADEVPEVAAALWCHASEVMAHFEALHNVMRDYEKGKLVGERIGPKKAPPRFIELRRATA